MNFTTGSQIFYAADLKSWTLLGELFPLTTSKSLPPVLTAVLLFHDLPEDVRASGQGHAVQQQRYGNKRQVRVIRLQQLPQPAINNVKKVVHICCAYHAILQSNDKKCWLIKIKLCAHITCLRRTKLQHQRYKY